MSRVILGKFTICYFVLKNILRYIGVSSFSSLFIFVLVVAGHPSLFRYPLELKGVPGCLGQVYYLLLCVEEHT